MNMRGSTQSIKNPGSNFMMAAFLASVMLMAVTILWNWFSPQEGNWPLLVGDVITILPAIGAAVAGTLLLREFGRDEKPRSVWFWFALGWWAWVAGEVCGLGYDLFNIAYGDLSIYDIFWTAGYICFGISLFFQYRNIYSFKKVPGLIFGVAGAAFVLLLTLGFTEWAVVAGLGEGMSWFSLYLAVFYPVCDLVVGITALWLAFLFGRGTWGRPWWGLIVFAIADGINVFLWIGGDKVIPGKTAAFLDPLSATIYNGGYVVAMLGFLLILALNFWSSSPPEGASPTAA